MNHLLEQLQAYGADVKGALDRFLGDEGLYENCFTIFLEDESFAKLGQAIATENYEGAFEAAHTLKGIAGNMGVTPLYQVICQMVEDLRGGNYTDLSQEYAAIMTGLEQLKKLRE